MNQSFKKKVIAASMASAFALVGAGFVSVPAVGLISEASANAFADTTQSVAITSGVNVTAAVSRSLVGQQFVLTENISGAISAGNLVFALDNSAKFRAVTVSDPVTNGAAFTANGGRVITSAGNGNAKMTTGGFTPVGTLTIGGVVFTVTYDANTDVVTIANDAGVASTTATAAGVVADANIDMTHGEFHAALINALNSVFAPGSATVTKATADSTVGIVAFTNLNAGAGSVLTLSTSLALPGGTATMATASQTASTYTTNAAPTTYIDSNGRLVAAVTASTSGAVGKPTLSGIVIDTNSSTVGSPVNVSLHSSSTSTGVTAGTNTVLANVTNQSVTVALATSAVPVTGAVGQTVTLPNIVITETVPGSIASGGATDEVVMALPTGYTFAVDSNASYTNGLGQAANPNESTTSTQTINVNAGSTTSPGVITLGGTTAMQMLIPANASTGDVNATVTVKKSDGTSTVQTIKVATVAAAGLTTALKDNSPTGVATVYTGRTYASGSNGGALVDGITITETAPGSLAANGTVTVTTSNATMTQSDGTTTVGVTLDTAGTNEFATTSDTATQTSTTVNTFTRSGTASSSVGNGRVVTFPSLKIGATVGPVTATIAGTSVTSSQSAITIANAVDATAASVSAAVSADIGQQSVALPTLTITEAGAGVLAQSSGSAGTVILTLQGGANAPAQWKTTGNSGKWCGTALTSGALAVTSTGGGAGTNDILTVTLPSVSSGSACALEVSGIANVTSTAPAGSSLYAAITGTAQPTAATVTLANIRAATVPNIPAATDSGTNTSKTISSTFGAAANDIGRVGSIFVVAVLPNGQIYSRDAAGAWFLWDGVTAFKAVQTGVTLSNSITASVISGLDVSSLVGTQVYVGYGIGALGNSAYTNMLTNATYNKVYTIQ